jgi:hypothetical protein
VTSPHETEQLTLWEVVEETDVLAYRVPDLPRVAGLGRTMFYDAIRSGELKARKYRSATLVLRSDLIAFLEALPVLKLGE